jgi:fibronectin type 3 domain-containing protein
MNFVGGLSLMFRFSFSKSLLFVLTVFLTACGGGYGGGNNGGGGGGVAPASPSGLNAAPGNAQVTLTWTASSGATTYNVKRGTATGGPYTTVSGPSVATFTDMSLTNGTTYYYVVSAVNTYGESANSAEKSAKPAIPVPASPSGLTATPGNTQIGLSWTASANATSYNLKRSTTTGGPYTTISSPTTTNFTDSSLTNFTAYFYVVSAVNASGESANSTQISSTPITIPNAPTGVTATAGNAQVSLAWTAVLGAASYKVKRGTTTGGPYTTVSSPSVATFTDTNLTNGTTYFYIVTAVNAAGESSNSAEKSAMPALPIPAAPTNFVAAAADTQVNLSWTASANASSYHVKRSTTSGGPYTQVGAPTTTSFNDTRLTNGTTYFYVVSALNTSGESANSSQASATPTSTPPDVTVTVNPASTHSISPWIYGINSYGGTPNPPHVTMDRAGGNRWTAYNWENNFSNAGNDFLYENDNFLCNGACNASIPGEAVRRFIAADHTAGIASLMTVQLQGFVSADGNSQIDVTQPLANNLAAHFKQVVDKKSTVSSTAFTLTPPTTDANVYMDEFLWALDQKFPGEGIFSASPTTHPTFVSLDNEPELWNSTHQEVQGSTMVTSDDYIAKTITMSKALKDQFPDALIFGPAHYGFQGLFNWQGELTSTATGANWFPDKYLQAISSASATYGKPIVDVYDFHWYPEVYDDVSPFTRITSMSGTTLTDGQVQHIVQAPRDLWDPTWHDPTNHNPFIYQELGSDPTKGVQIIPRVQAKINAEFPSMKGIAVTEYEGGGFNHIAGTVAEADMLGIFGVQDLFAASFWPPSGTYDYSLAGFRAFRGFDGANANFGDTSVQATSSDTSKVSAYISTDSTTPGRVVIVAINRSTSSKVTAINGITLSGTATIYQITATSASGQTPVHPLSVGTQAASGTSLKITLPALSVTTIDIH